MADERRRRIEHLYQAARERGRDVLAGATPDVRLEVERLLAQDADEQILDPAAGELLDSTVTRWAVGAQVGPYRIEALLGAGGMGEVFRATDTRLDRPVAIKTPREQLGERFHREARAVASLNHPHICTLYDIGPDYLVMELVEGETLAHRLNRGKLSFEQTIRYGSQIADALAVAHSKGIVHRDLKPGNIMLTESGVKVLDFGLAKTLQDETLTASRMVMGTPAYMAPEQREGKGCDTRSDIYALGLMLYEMATGKRSPTPGRLSGELAPDLEHIICKCLEHEPDLRYQHAVEVRTDLERLRRATDSISAAVNTKQITRKVRAVIAGAAILLALGPAAGYFYLHRKPKLTNKDTLVLADFTNTTGDQVFDGTLRQGLAVQLEQSPYLSLVSDERIQQVLPRMGKPADAALTPAVAREVCERTGSAAVLEGSLDSLGSEYVLGLRAKNCRTGDVLDEEQVQAPKKEDVLNALSQAASRFRTRVGESLASVNDHNTPLEEATTPSLEALKAFSLGKKILFTSGSSEALPHFERATQIDPKFAMAYHYIGRLYGDMGESLLSAKNTSKAYELRDRCSEREKFLIAAAYDSQVTGNIEKAAQTFELLEHTYPRDVEAPGPLSGYIYPVLARYDKTIEQAKLAIAIDPHFPFAYVNLSTAYHILGRLKDAEDTLRLASERKIVISELLIERYIVSFLEGDQAGMDGAAAQAKGTAIEDWMRDQEAITLAYHGRLRQAKSTAQEAAYLAVPAKHEAAALYMAGSAVWDALFGNAADARESAKKALDLSQARDVEYGAAFALALSGDLSPAERLAGDLEKRFPEDTSVQFSYLPVLHALFALNHSQPSKAIEELTSARYELGTPGSWFNANFGALYPIYVRGLARLASHQAPDAAAEFRKIIDYRGVPGNDPVAALVHLQLGRALALSGDKTKAKAAYQVFLTLWKDADPTIPILRQAKAEYASL